MDSNDARLLWVATHGGGLICVDPERGAITQVVTVAEGLPSDLLYGCSSDGQGHLRLGTRYGVARYTVRTGRCVVVGLCGIISIGLPDWLDGPHHETILTDAYLYAATRAGRNRTRSAVDAGALDTQEGHAGYLSP